MKATWATSSKKQDFFEQENRVNVIFAFWIAYSISMNNRRKLNGEKSKEYR